jgi:hypothetical protein
MTTAAAPRKGLPLAFFLAAARCGVRLTPLALWVRVRPQVMIEFHRPRPAGPADRHHRHPAYAPLRGYRISTSRLGAGQQADSHRTPLGLHRVARKIGGGWPVGTVFKSRSPAGFTWSGQPEAAIAHRILWLEGLEPGFNRGGNVDSFVRYIYLHGVGDETTLGRPASIGCVHLAARDLLPLFDRLPAGTLVWISAD